MTRSNDFAQAFAAAHTELGLSRISVTHILQKIVADPAFLFGDELRQLGGQCPVHAGTHQDDLDKVAVNTLLAYLFHSLKDYIDTHLPAEGRGAIPLVPPPRSPFAATLATAEARAAAPPEMLVSYLRDSTCHLLDEVITRWAAEVLAEEERCRQLGGGQITALAAASFVLRTLLDGSELYQRAGYDMLSITKTGSHTAIHICWSLVEAAPLLVPGRDDAFYDDLVRRSLKQVVPLSMASLGMLVHYMEASGMEPPDGLAIHLLPKTQTAFELDENGLICLRAEPIAAFRKPEEEHYTGCPAFYAPGLIKTYLDIVASIALEHDVYERLKAR